MLKVTPHPDYPPEEGRYLRGNDSSCAAVAVILNCEAEKIPADLERLVRAGLESGAALSGTVQTENIGFEKIVCNVVANPNIRYIILGGPESEGHLTGQALKALIATGVDEKKRILGTDAPHPFLYNLPMELIERFRKQVSLVDVQFEGDPEVIRQAVWSCYQEQPVTFRGYSPVRSGSVSRAPPQREDPAARHPALVRADRRARARSRREGEAVDRAFESEDAEGSWSRQPLGGLPSSAGGPARCSCLFTWNSRGRLKCYIRLAEYWLYCYIRISEYPSIEAASFSPFGRFCG